MPFVQRVVEPRLLSRVQLFNEDGSVRVNDGELEAVTNFTLCSALKQLASLSLVADDIFKELGDQLKLIYGRCEKVKVKLVVLGDKVEKFDPKKVPVPVSDICSFAQTKEHYAAKHPMDTNLFSVDSRPQALKALYEAASRTPVHAMRQLDRWRRDGHRSSKFFVCTPVLGAKRRKMRERIDIDIETRMPAVVEDLRRWTSDEALGDVTVGPDCTRRIDSILSDGDMTDGTIVSDDEGIDHKLPSPEEQLQVVALRFPAEVVAVDISGRSFDRMSMQRRSLMTGEYPSKLAEGDTVRRRGRTRRPRNRRNTLAGTDQREIENVLSAGDEQTSPDTTQRSKATSATVPRSKSSDLLRSNNKKESSDIKISRFNSLKQWGKNQYDKFLNKSNEKNENVSTSSGGGSKTKVSLSEDGVDDFNLYDTVTMKRRRDMDKERKTHERNSSISSSEKSLPVTTSTLSSVMNIAVKLRESSLQRRQRRNGTNKDEPHSSSGNWSASSESGRASIGSEITSTTHPKSTTSAATSSNSLNLHPPSSVNSRRRFNFNASTSSSVTSEGSTLTPDIIHDLHEDGDSVYSCDTEGYYTSFHMDSGLKTLKEEELPSTPLQSTSAFCNSDSNNTVMSAENEYELFGKGSTSTTTSSAGTVCTTLRAAESNRSLVIGPAVPERKSSLSKLSNKSSKSPESSLGRDYVDKTGTIKRSPATAHTKPAIVGLIQKKDSSGDVSPDSGHNTSSSPIESVSSPNGIRSGSDFEFSESSDMEGPERTERIRVKTTINSSRIPSMCAITPPHSDDESSSNSSYKKHIEANNLRNSLENEKELDKENGNININQRIISTNVNGTQKLSLVNVNTQSGYATVENLDEGVTASQVKVSATTIRAPSPSGGSVIVKSETDSVTKISSQPLIKSSLLPLNNMFGRIKSNLTSLGLSRRDRSKSPNNVKTEPISDSMDEYVTLADVRNNNEKYSVEEITYANDAVNKNLNTVLSGKVRDAEYVSLNELPNSDNNAMMGADSSLERKKRQGARVMLDAEGKVVYSSDSLRRRKPPSTFEPGPFVKLSTQASPRSSPQMHRTLKSIRPIASSQDQMKLNVPQAEFYRPMSPTSGNKVIIKASGNPPEVIRSPSTVVQPASPKMRPLSPKGAYVHVQAPGGPLSPKEPREGVIPPISSSTSPTLGRYQTQEEMFSYANNEAYYASPQSYYQGGNFYSTLPTKKTQYFACEIPQERSVTPDITRGLERGNSSFSHGSTFKDDQNLVCYGHQVGIPVAREYNESPVYKDQYSSRIASYSDRDDSLKISPIDPIRHSGGLKTSTPSQLKASSNLESKLLSPKRSAMSNDELYAVIHKTKKKLNIEDDLNRMSPSLVAQVEPETSTPKKVSVETGYIGSRQSWSPSKGEYIDFNSDIDKFSPINEPKNRQSWACSDRKGTKKTSTLDFKRLLLQKSSSLSGNKKMSAVEQLKLSKQQMHQKTPNENNKPYNNTGDMTILDLSASPRSLVNRRLLSNPPSSPERSTVKPTPKILSPRSQWRFLNPRSDVLSSTILEDCREDDSGSNASKSSLEKRNAQSVRSSVGSPKFTPEEHLSKPIDTKQIQSSLCQDVDNTSSNTNTSTTRSEPKPNIKYSSVSERLSAQRAQFFGTTVSTEKKETTPKVPPTLETAF
ncbi:uncharacterized protein LOC115889022 isoform X2 [Sitophilus oryzae]|uniref:Uncharacterized protein LOC115889022 isoform X2 n=1 Tax=Sitophilus oryzae TaxID=7048 RepID=A0A6J2YLC4_SITOR|nr:uncharacterized protein LOC115889022 isoform X2 [Sitophilus oryzae]